MHVNGWTGDLKAFTNFWTNSLWKKELRCGKKSVTENVIWTKDIMKEISEYINIEEKLERNRSKKRPSSHKAAKSS